MLRRGDKPSKEPTLSIGMILPKDLRKQLVITIPRKKQNKNRSQIRLPSS